jgi:hypothetical protein
MASSGKKKTTMAKLMRESRLRERRVEKKARKDARKQAALHGPVEPGESVESSDGVLTAPEGTDPVGMTVESQ